MKHLPVAENNTITAATTRTVVADRVPLSLIILFPSANCKLRATNCPQSVATAGVANFYTRRITAQPQQQPSDVITASLCTRL